MSATADLASHPLADLVPSMTDEEYARLREDIATNGLLEAITLCDGQVLDGRHRLRACREASIEPRFTQYDGDSPAQFVLSVNVVRRQLTTSQRAMIATRFLPELEREAAKRQGAFLRTAERDSNGRAKSVSGDTDLGSRQGKPSRAAEQAAKAVGVGGSTVARAKRIVEQAPDLAEQVNAGELSLATAAERIAGTMDRGGQRPKAVLDPSLMSTRHQQTANKNRQRIHRGLATLEGLIDGLAQLDLTNIQHVTHDDEAAHWHRQIHNAVGSLRQFNRALEEAQL